MSLGVHFALDAATDHRLLAAYGDDDAVMTVIEEIEESGGVLHCDTDKAWEAVHRALTDGQLLYENGEFPLSAVILGGRQLLVGDDEYTVSHLTAEQVREVADAVGKVTPEWFRERYYAIPADEYAQPLDEEDLEYSWRSVPELAVFFRQAAERGCPVIFTVDA